VAEESHNQTGSAVPAQAVTWLACQSYLFLSILTAAAAAAAATVAVSAT